MKYEFENSIGMLTAGISNEIGKMLEHDFNEVGLEVNAIEWTVLSFLNNNEYYTQNELSKIIVRNKVFVKRLVDKMEKKKLVQRQTMAKDKRHNKISITKKGMDKYKSLLTVVESVLDKVFYDFDEIEVNTLIRLLKNVKRNIN